MGIEKTQAIILKQQDLRETSVLTTFFSKDHGKINGVAKGVRTSFNRGHNGLEIFSLSEIVFYKRSRGNLYTVSQCDLLDYFKEIRRNYKKLIYATYFVDILNAVTPSEDKNEALFELILETLKALSREKNPEAIKNIYEIKMLIISGFKPRLDVCITCAKPISKQAKFSIKLGGLLCQECFLRDSNSFEIYDGTLASMLHIEKTDFSHVWRLNLTPKVKKQLGEILNDFIQFHIDKKIKSKEFIDSFSQI